MRFSMSLILCGLICFPLVVFAEEVVPPVQASQEIVKPEVVEVYLEALRLAESAGDLAKQWEVLMELAWVLDERGEHKRALEYSDRALTLANKSKDDFLIGRSLSWHGWAYARLGYYDAATEFYRESLKRGMNESKEIVHPVLWGFATQELGYISFLKGDIATAKSYLDQSLGFARSNNVLMGIAEGAAYLSELSLAEGNINKAIELASEAFKASVKCNCSNDNTARAMTMLVNAQYAQVKASGEEGGKESLKILAQQLIDYSKEVGSKRYLAEGLLVMSRVIDSTDFKQRYKLVTEAFEILSEMESDLRGSSEAALGQLFWESGDESRAKYYLENGLAINAQLLRKIDQSYQLAELSEITWTSGDTKDSLVTLKKAITAALEAGAIKKGYADALVLVVRLRELGYEKVALREGKSVLQIGRAYAQGAEGVDSTIFQEEELALVEAISKLKLLSKSGHSPK